MEDPKLPWTSTKGKTLHYICKCNPPRCIQRLETWKITICEICAEQFECAKTPDNHKCDRILHYCKMKGCNFTSFYKRNLRRHIRQVHKAMTSSKLRQKQTIDCIHCTNTEYELSNKICRGNINIAIKHSLPKHNWLENKIKTKTI